MPVPDRYGAYHTFNSSTVCIGDFKRVSVSIAAVGSSVSVSTFVLIPLNTCIVYCNLFWKDSNASKFNRIYKVLLSNT